MSQQYTEEFNQYLELYGIDPIPNIEIMGADFDHEDDILYYEVLGKPVRDDHVASTVKVARKNQNEYSKKFIQWQSDVRTPAIAALNEIIRSRFENTVCIESHGRTWLRSPSDVFDCWPTNIGNTVTAAQVDAMVGEFSFNQLKQLYKAIDNKLQKNDPHGNQ